MSFEKTPIYIYKSGQDGDGAFLDPVSVLDDYATLSFTRGHYAPGSFELTTNKETSRASDLIRGRIIRIGEDNTANVIINSIRKSMDSSGNTVLNISGKELWSVLERRTVVPTAGSAYFETSTTDPIETGVKTIIAENAGSSAVASRQMASLNVIASDGGGSAYKFSERYSNLLESVSKALLATNSGLTCTLNHTTGKWDLGWTAGTDRTATVILSSKFNTAQSATVNESDSAYRNIVIAAGQGEGANRNVRVLYDTTEPTDLDRREIFRDMRDLELNASIDKRAAQVLAEQSYTRTLEVSPLAYSRVVYGRDYFVGDKITFDELGVTQEAWITSATEQWKAGSYELRLGLDRAPATIGGQVNALSVANTLAMATIDPVTGSEYPSAEFLFECHSFDGIPDIMYPDNVAGTTYLQAAWATVDGWTAITVGGGLALYSRGAGTAFATRSFGVSAIAGKVVIFKIRRTLGTGDFRIDWKENSGTYISFTSWTVGTDWVLVSGVAPALSGQITWYSTATNTDFEVDWIYIGDGSYTWTVGDDSGNGRTITPKGGLSRVIGRSGWAMEFDGFTGYGTGTLSGFTDKINVHFFDNLSAFTATQKVLWESSTDSTATTGAIAIIGQLVSGANRIYARVKTATGTLGGHYDLSSVGEHSFDLQYDQSVASNLALRLWVDESEVSLTYDFPYSGAGALPTVYNGSFYVHSRAGASLFADGWMDELRIDATTLTDAEHLALSTMPFPESVDNTGSSSIVRSLEPTIYGAIPIMNATSQLVNKTIPSGYNAIVYGAYDIGTTTLTIDGALVIL